MKNLLKNKVTWVVAVVLAALAVVGGVYFSDGYDSGYTEKPGVVYNNDGDGHAHDHPSYGVIE